MCQAEATQETCRILIFILYYFLLLVLYERKGFLLSVRLLGGRDVQSECTALARRGATPDEHPLVQWVRDRVNESVARGDTCLPACPSVSPALLAAACAAWGADPSGRAAVSHVADVRNAPFAWPPAHIPVGDCAAVRALSCPRSAFRDSGRHASLPALRAGSSARMSRRAAPNGAMRLHGHWRPAAHRARRPGPACLAQAGVRARAGCRRAATHSPRSLAMSTRVDICTGC